VADPADRLDAEVATPELAAYRAGAPGARERMVASYAAVVRAAILQFLAARCRGRMDLADDLTHEVFLALFRDDGRKLRQFEGRNGCSLAGWLRVVAVRVAIDLLRRERHSPSLDDDTGPMLELRRSLSADTPSPEDTVVAAETGARLRDAIRGLASKDRVLVELHIIRGVPIQEVATTLGVTTNAAYVRKSRVLERLRQSLSST
jgi:RNA polymerase sigma-70 factor (ECF subfamily)